MRRATAIIRPKQRSAVVSVCRTGTTVTAMPRAFAASMSMCDGLTDMAAIIRSFGLAVITSRSMRSCSRQNRMSHRLTAAISARLAMTRLASGFIVTAAIWRKRPTAALATGWVMNTRARGTAGSLTSP